MNAIVPTRARPIFRTGGIQTEEQLRELFAIDVVAYGDASISFQLFREWWLAFPAGLSVVFERERIVAAFGIWPLSPASASRLKAGEMSESELDPSSMRAFQDRPAESWYASGVVLLPGAPRRAIQTLLVEGWPRWQQEVAISFPCEILAMVSNEAGRRILQRSSFSLLRAGADMPDGFPLYRRAFASLAELQAPLHPSPSRP